MSSLKAGRPRSLASQSVCIISWCFFMKLPHKYSLFHTLLAWIPTRLTNTYSGNHGFGIMLSPLEGGSLRFALLFHGWVVLVPLSCGPLAAPALLSSACSRPPPESRLASFTSCSRWSGGACCRLHGRTQPQCWRTWGVWITMSARVEDIGCGRSCHPYRMALCLHMK